MPHLAIEPPVLPPDDAEAPQRTDEQPALTR
jgi:hypothetical protein